MLDKDRNTVVELEKVVKKYRTKGSFFGAHQKDVVALSGISFKIRRGEIFGLVGESGSGKTTAGRLIVKLEEADEGTICLDGYKITALKGRGLKQFRRRVQMIFQDPYQSLNAQLSVSDTISEPLIIHRLGKANDREETVRRTMKDVGLSPPDDFLHRYPHQLSGGQRQRVAIARSMVLEPDFVVADEPTSMLDASISAQIFNILLELRDRLNVTFLFITHSLAAARYLCDRIAVIYRGHLMEMGPADEVIHNPKHPYTRALIDALPKFGDCGEVRRYGTLLRVPRLLTEVAGCPFLSRCRTARQDPCSRKKPSMEDTGDSHWVACFYPEAETAPVSEDDSCYYGI